MKLKKSMKNRSAVSPVIATILMVAITVVLAAVLYVMVMGFGGDPAKSTPVGDFNVSKTAVNEAKFSLTAINPTAEQTDCKFSVTVGSSVYVFTIADNKLSAVPSGFPTTLTATYFDLSADGKVGTGDYFTIKNTGDEATTVSVALVYTVTSGAIAEDSANLAAAPA